jgi:hypothetical protein
MDINDTNWFGTDCNGLEWLKLDFDRLKRIGMMVNRGRFVLDWLELTLLTLVWTDWKWLEWRKLFFDWLGMLEFGFNWLESVECIGKINQAIKCIQAVQQVTKRWQNCGVFKCGRERNIIWLLCHVCFRLHKARSCSAKKTTLGVIDGFKNWMFFHFIIIV